VSAPGQSAPVLAVMAHPDDPEIVGGRHARPARPRRALTLAVTEHEAARMAEAAAGAAILGARPFVLPAPVSAAAVADLITEIRPDVVITHPSRTFIPNTGRRPRPSLPPSRRRSSPPAAPADDCIKFLPLEGGGISNPSWDGI
jgi:LmbE family N-acetylglucosaminyl deacetylase